jgi:hypothetical protein
MDDSDDSDDLYASAVQSGVDATLSRWKSRVQIPFGAPRSSGAVGSALGCQPKGRGFKSRLFR